jgi:hypothetical protein
VDTVICGVNSERESFGAEVNAARTDDRGASMRPLGGRTDELDALGLRFDTDRPLVVEAASQPKIFDTAKRLLMAGSWSTGSGSEIFSFADGLSCCRSTVCRVCEPEKDVEGSLSSREKKRDSPRLLSWLQ